MKYKMKLEHLPNPDISGYWETPSDTKPIVEEGNTLQEMQDKFRDWIIRNGLGSGNVPFIHLKDKDNNPIARFSYNGRLWMLGSEYVEITINQHEEESNYKLGESK